MIDASVDRRAFLGQLGAGSLGAMLAGGAASSTHAAEEPKSEKPYEPVSDRKIRVGIVGYGVCRFGAQFSFQDHPNVEIVAVSDLIPEPCPALPRGAWPRQARDDGRAGHLRVDRGGPAASGDCATNRPEVHDGLVCRRFPRRRGHQPGRGLRQREHDSPGAGPRSARRGAGRSAEVPRRAQLRRAGRLSQSRRIDPPLPPGAPDRRPRRINPPQPADHHRT